MANILRTKNGKAIEYLLSVNTPDYDKDLDNLVNPDLSAVIEIPMKYWKIDIDKVVEMTPAEKLITDTTERQTRLDEAKNQLAVYVNTIDLIEVLIKVGNTQWSQGKTVTKVQILDLLYTEIEKRT